MCTIINLQRQNPYHQCIILVISHIKFEGTSLKTVGAGGIQQQTLTIENKSSVCSDLAVCQKFFSNLCVQVAWGFSILKSTTSSRPDHTPFVNTSYIPPQTHTHTHTLVHPNTRSRLLVLLLPPAHYSLKPFRTISWLMFITERNYCTDPQDAIYYM